METQIMNWELAVVAFLLFGSVAYIIMAQIYFLRRLMLRMETIFVKLETLELILAQIAIDTKTRIDIMNIIEKYRRHENDET